MLRQKFEKICSQQEIVCFSVIIVAILCAFVWYWNRVTESNAVLALGAICILLLIGLCVAATMLKIRLEQVYLAVFGVALFVFGLISCAILPPGSVPDEATHYLWTYQFAEMLSGDSIASGEEAESQQQGFWMRGEDYSFYENNVRDAINYDQYYSTFKALTESDNSSAVFYDADDYSFSGNPPQVRLAAASGILLAQFLGLNAASLFYLGRVFSFLLFCALAVAAVRITPVGKTVFMAVTLLPMTLQEAASYSYDSALIAFALLLTALLFNSIFREDSVTAKEFVPIAVVAALLAPCKMLYSAIALLVFLVPSKRFASTRLAILTKCSLLLVVALSIVICNVPNFLNSSATATEQEDSTLLAVATRGTETGIWYTLSDFTAHPGSTLCLFISTLIHRTDFYIQSGLGASLGWFQKNLVSPWWLTIGYAFCLFLTSLPHANNDECLASHHKALFLLIFALCFLAVEYSLATSHTFNTEACVEGVQGRYFLPVLPLLLLGLSPKRIQIKADGQTTIHTKTLLALALLNSATYVSVFATAIS